MRSDLKILYITGYSNISWRPHDSQSQNLEGRHPNPRIDAYATK